MNPLTSLQLLAIRIVVSLVIFLGAFAAGWFTRGDCAKEVRATESTATAHAAVKAESINTKYGVKNEQHKQTYGAIVGALNALPPVQPTPAGCPALQLDDDELRLWNAGNQGRYEPVQQAGVDGPRGDAAPVAGP